VCLKSHTRWARLRYSHAAKVLQGYESRKPVTSGQTLQVGDADMRPFSLCSFVLDCRLARPDFRSHPERGASDQSESVLEGRNEA
jgi:hypothetical protein